MLDNIMLHLRTPLGGLSKKAHLVGIGGSGMRALSSVLLARGWQLSGSDAQSDGMAGLAGGGIRTSVGHDGCNVPSDAALLVYSDAVPPENPERQEAQRRGIAMRSYAEMIGELASESQAAENQ